MKQINQIIFEGNFLHFTSPKGSMPLSFLVENHSKYNNVIHVVIADPRIAKYVIENARRENVFKIVGSVQTFEKTLCIFAEFIEIKVQK